MGHADNQVANVLADVTGHMSNKKSSSKSRCVAVRVVERATPAAEQQRSTPWS